MPEDNQDALTDTADYLQVCQRIQRARDRKAKSLSLTGYRALDRIPDLDGLLSLNHFMVFDSSIRSLSSLAAIKNVRRLYAVKSQVTDLSGLEELKSLTQLYLWGNLELRDLSPLQGLTRLRTLVLAGTKVTDLSPLRNLKNLLELRLESTPVENLEPLRGLSSWRSFNCPTPMSRIFQL